MNVPFISQRLEKGFTESQVIETDLRIDRCSGLADRVGDESFTLEACPSSPAWSMSELEGSVLR